MDDAGHRPERAAGVDDRRRNGSPPPARAVFGTWYKALGFVIALEGYMTFTAGWLSGTALVFLIAINALANGCRVAAERDAELRHDAAQAAGSARGYSGRSRPGAVPRRCWASSRTG